MKLSRPNFYVLEYFHHKLATLVAPPTDGTATCLEQSHIFERVVPTGPITMLQLLIGLIQSRDNRGRHVLSSETTDVEG